MGSNGGTAVTRVAVPHYTALERSPVLCGALRYIATRHCSSGLLWFTQTVVHPLLHVTGWQVSPGAGLYSEAASAMSDGGEIPVEVRVEATGRPGQLKLRASEGRILFNPPPPGPCSVKPGSDVEDLKNALDILSMQARAQQPESPS